MEERFPPVDERLAVAEPEPPPRSTRPEPASVPPGSAEAYLELLATHVRELEGYVFDLVEHRDELLAEQEHLAARIRVLRRAVQRAASDEQAPELDEALLRSDVAVWSRLWERPPRVVDAAADPTGGRSAGETIEELRATSERGYVAELRAQQRRRTIRWLATSVAAIWISGTVLGAAVLFRPAAAPSVAPEPVAGVDAGAPVETVEAAADVDYVPTTMPDVLGQRLSEATGALVDAQLTVVDLRFVRGRQGVVVASDPTAGEALAAGTGVTLSVGRG